MTPRLIHAIDISNYQPAYQDPRELARLLDSLNPRPEHVVVRLSLEDAARRNIAIAQLKAAVVCGCTVGGYAWAYRASIPGDTIRDAAATATAAGVTLPILWLDLEDAQGPDVLWLRQAVTAAKEQGIEIGVYSGAWWWPSHMGATLEFAQLPLWTAAYDNNPTLGVPSYGGMAVVGHQWTDKAPDGSGLDRDVFLAEYAGL